MTPAAARAGAPWMARVLWLAAAYNGAWGAAVVLAPLAPFRWLGLPPPRHVEDARRRFVKDARCGSAADAPRSSP